MQNPRQDTANRSQQIIWNDLSAGPPIDNVSILHRRRRAKYFHSLGLVPRFSHRSTSGAAIVCECSKRDKCVAAQTSHSYCSEQAPRGLNHSRRSRASNVPRSADAPAARIFVIPTYSAATSRLADRSDSCTGVGLRRISNTGQWRSTISFRRARSASEAGLSRITSASIC